MVQDNVLYTFVGSSYAEGFDDPIGSPTWVDTLVEGCIWIELDNGKIADTIGSDIGSHNFRICRKNKKNVVEKSPWISGAVGGGLKVVSDGSYQAPTEGTWTYTPDTPPTDEEVLYSVWIVIKDMETTFGNKTMMKNIVYKTKIGDTATEVVDGLIKSFNAVMAREPERYITATDGGGFITFTAQNRPDSGIDPVAGIFNCGYYDFEVLPGDNGEVTSTDSVAGILTKCDIKEDEWFAQGNRGYGYRVDVLPVESQLSTEFVYGTLCNNDLQKVKYLKAANAQFTNVVGQSPASLVELHVYVPDDTTSNGYQTGTVTVWSWLNSVLSTADAIS